MERKPAFSAPRVDQRHPIIKQVYGSIPKSSEAMVKRGEMRDIVGNR